MRKLSLTIMRLKPETCDEEFVYPATEVEAKLAALVDKVD